MDTGDAILFLNSADKCLGFLQHVDFLQYVMYSILLSFGRVFSKIIFVLLRPILSLFFSLRNLTLHWQNNCQSLLVICWVTSAIVSAEEYDKFTVCNKVAGLGGKG